MCNININIFRIIYSLKQIILLCQKNIYKMIKNPKYKSIEMNTVKDRNKYLKTLNEQVNKSRMAVQTITSFRNTQMKFKKKIDQTQQQLYGTVLRINNESKKNVVLNELITLMKGQMFNFQKTQKRQQQKNEQQAEKSVKKIQYDIEQILQKHNQEIAKITSLKQAANCGRSQRVVFSNLFKKLEKQIKQTEELYKENLLKSEVARDIKTPIKLTGRLADKQSSQIKPQSKHSDTNMDSFQFDSTYSPNDGLFLTQQKYGSSQSENKAIDKSVNLYKELQTSEIIEPKNTSRSSGDKIEFYQSFLQKIKIHIGCSDISKAIQYFQKIDESNLTLLSQINSFNEQIQLYTHQMQQIGVHKRQSQCYENGKQLPANSCRRIRLVTDASDKNQQKEIQDGELQSFVAELLSIFGDQGMAEDNLKEFDQKLDLLIEATRQQDHLQHQDVHRATTANSEAAAVDIILDKMERFSQCEKLLDKNLFKQQYIKQISKNKKHKNKK